MYLLFDIGGTKMRLAISKDGKTIKKLAVVSTPKNFSSGLKLFKKTALKLSQGKKIKAVAGGIAGVFNFNKTKLFSSSNLRGWLKKPLKKSLEKIFKAPIFLENDAALAGLGEAIKGAGRGKKIVAYLTISTGIGGARIVNGKIDQRAVGFEPGHQIIKAGSKFFDLETQASGSGLKKRYHQSSKKISNPKIWQEVNRYLAYGLHNVAVFWSPEVIVLGGGMVKNPHFKIIGIKKYLKKTLTRFPHLPLIRKAKLKDLSGLYGALYYLKQLS